MSWQKYIKNKGMNIGIDQFGESAPYKEVYDHLWLIRRKNNRFHSKKIKRII